MVQVLTALIALIGALLVGGMGIYVGRLAGKNALDLETHSARVELYQGLVSAAEPLALYFPPSCGSGASSLDPSTCLSIGRKMSEWYFEKGGLLLSPEARDAYFTLARALTRASQVKVLAAPRFPDDADSISVASTDAYWKELDNTVFRGKDIETWPFGVFEGAAEPHLKFKDYVFIRKLSSDLRTELTKDIRSRRR